MNLLIFTNILILFYCHFLWQNCTAQSIKMDSVIIRLKPKDEKMVAVPVYADGEVVLSLTNYGAACGLKPEGTYLVIDPQNGKVKRRFEWKSRKSAHNAWVASQFHVHQGVVYSRNGGLIYAIDGLNRKQPSWQLQTVSLPNVVIGTDHYLSDRPGSTVFMLNDSMLFFSLNPTYPYATKGQLMDSLPVFYSPYCYESRHPLFALYRLKLFSPKAKKAPIPHAPLITSDDSASLTLLRVIGQRSPTPQNGFYYHHRWINSCYDPQRQWIFSNSMFEPKIQVWSLDGKLLGHFGERGQHLMPADTILPVSQYMVDSILTIPDRSYDSHWMQTLAHLDSIGKHSYKYDQMFFDTTSRYIIRRYLNPPSAKSPFAFWQVYEIKEGTKQGSFTPILHNEIAIPIRQQVIGFNQGIIYSYGKIANNRYLYRNKLCMIR